MITHVHRGTGRLSYCPDACDLGEYISAAGRPDPLYDKVTSRGLSWTPEALLAHAETAWEYGFREGLLEPLTLVRRHFMRTRWQAFVAWVRA